MKFGKILKCILTKKGNLYDFPFPIYNKDVLR